MELFTRKIPDLLIGNDALNCTVRLDGNTAAAGAAAEVMLRLANETDEGFGNFRFAALACVPPGAPFFPAAYHEGPASLSVGLQGAGIVARAAEGGLDGLTERVTAAVTEEATPVVRLVERIAADLGARASAESTCRRRRTARTASPPRSRPSWAGSALRARSPSRRR